ncbi:MULTISPECIES: glucose-1-phosphate thymidylyltransferase RfbA [Commensalibacter]|uniref:Glucose-1-phosphate thymidylyltransferase n=1 Tax=Commensalibacter melissae TaxID=2070537 RepID=A0A318N5V0_9PROT|nr:MULTISPECIES: glucose-1-phosphate thymidylyltransferase RfbA [Commensalibacter]MCT6852160.1 glucose-1-phosphate thymidylyltransferase RfbA [Commensalibacter sp.]MBH9973544.1 glucose-1-phosphate thymidylyltransferase RfbA [Commensalibacter melissae]MBI0017308.1 glucose-1-phosphate thymidylyltransferase RfbA [Commensalibacter sp. B14384M2]MBI0018970.1 glucose-1-phosphate thymidylyltransferase RfbA [Commensalibacter sp. W8133]MBI0049396.1 glucose-1-phosphate thymidylyltransferase RfbA [Commens
MTNQHEKSIKGILLAGGSGTRLYPLTAVSSKQLLPIYDKPMIYYPLTTLMLAGIREIMIISTPHDIPQIKRLLGNGSDIGMKFDYCVQPKPEGIAQAFVLAEEWLDASPCALVLGDNLIFASHLSQLLQKAVQRKSGATIFSYQVSDPERYGVVTFDENGKVTQIVEKPKDPPSNWAVTGLYFYDSRVTEYAKKIKPSARGEYEITDLNKIYFENDNLHVERLGRGCAWLDAGIPASLMQAGNFVQMIQARQGILVGSPAEVAYHRGFINAEQLRAIAKKLNKTDLGRMLMDVANEGFNQK